MIAQFAIIFGSYGIGMANMFMGNIGIAQKASKNIMREIHTPNKIEVDPKNLKTNPNFISNKSTSF